MAPVQPPLNAIPQHEWGLESEYALTKELRSYAWEAVLLADCLWKVSEIRKIYLEFLVAENYHEFTETHSWCLQQLLSEVTLSNVDHRTDLLNRFTDQQVIAGATSLIQQRVKQCLLQSSNSSMRRFLEPLLSREAGAGDLAMVNPADVELASIGNERDMIACSGLQQLQSACMSWFTQGSPSKIFNVQLSSSIRLPADVQTALKRGSRESVSHAVGYSAISGQRGYSWLRDMIDTHLSCADIAQILYDNKRDPSWIPFLPAHRLNLEDTLFRAAHNGNPMKTRLNSLQHIGRLIQQYCGVGGITEKWLDGIYQTANAGVSLPGIEFKDTEASITYVSHPTESNWSEIVQKLDTTLKDFSWAIRILQITGACQNYLPILTYDDIGLASEPTDKWERRSVRVQRIQFDDVKVILNLLTRYKTAQPQTTDEREVWAQANRKILPCLRYTDWSPNNVRANVLLLHESALVAQSLCIAVVAWTQAYLGPLRLFFLERPIHQITLKGINFLTQGYIQADVAEVACVKEMFHERAFVFRTIGGSKHKTPCHRYALLAKPEDLVQLWGPGYLLHDPLSRDLIRGVSIGGKVIARVAGDKNPCSIQTTVDQARCTAFWKAQDILIAYDDNSSDIQYAAALPYLTNVFKNISRIKGGFSLADSDTAVNAAKSDDGSVSYYGQQWNRIESRPAKAFYTQQDDLSLLESLQHRWGLQVNFCTSSARRVRIVDAVAELLPHFGPTIDDQMWKALPCSYNSVEETLQLDLHDLSLWLDFIYPDQRAFMYKVFRAILTHLQSTGIVNNDRTLVASSLQQGASHRQKLTIPQGWNAFLADGPRTATFAYISSKCFEGKSTEASQRCRGANQPPINTLYTQVTCSIPPLESPNNEQQYTLEQGQSYFIRQSRHSQSPNSKLYTTSDDDLWYMAKVSTSVEAAAAAQARSAAMSEGGKYHFEEEDNGENERMRLTITKSTIPAAMMNRITVSKDGLSRVLREATFDDEASEIVDVIVN